MSNTITTTETIQVVTFTVTGKNSKPGNYAVPIEQVKEIKIVDAITTIPRSKNNVKGVLNLRGKIIPIVDVNGKLGMSNHEVDSTKQRILVAEVNGSLTGLLVDEVNEVMRLSSNEIEPIPQNTFESNAYVKGIINIKDRLVVILDIAKFLSDSIDDIHEATTDSEPSLPNPKKHAEPISEDDEGVLPEIDAIINEASN